MNTRREAYRFEGAFAPPAVGSREGRFCSLVAGTAGTPTVQSINGGAMRLALTVDDEAQRAALYMGDVLPYDIGLINRIEMILKVGELAATDSLVFGLGSARNDAFDDVAQHAWFRMEGSNAVVVETDDGTNDNDDVATNQTPATDKFFRFHIDFASGITTVSPPSVSLGRTSHIKFLMGNSLGSMREIATGTRFDMTNYSGYLQFLVELQKSGGVQATTVQVLELAIERKLEDFA